jgi:ethanolamine ammonia-lyase small subunit
MPSFRMAALEVEGRAGPPADPGRAGRDPWLALAAHTAARIALGRAGGSLRTETLLELKLAHAAARDAVHAPFDVPAMERAFRERGLGAEILETGAADQQTYIARPDLGRTLDPDSAARLRAMSASWGPRDLAVLVSGGLSATAAASHAAETVGELARILGESGWTIFPIFIAPFARVKLQDAVGEILGARHSVILLGERPGLSSHDSLGAYMTYEPRANRTDADRNCVSNIRTSGLAPLLAARKLAHMLSESRRMGLSGTALRDAGAVEPGLAGGSERVPSRLD